MPSMITIEGVDHTAPISARMISRPLPSLGMNDASPDMRGFQSQAQSPLFGAIEVNAECGQRLNRGGSRIEDAFG
ncbi:hypothetical protein ACVIN2_002974 [Bradyrhizobium sp. USDA 3650]